MTTLRAKIALLLVVAIVAVVGLATAVAVTVIGPPRPPGPMIVGEAERIEALAAVARERLATAPDQPIPHAVLAAEPAAGEPVPDAADWLNEELARRGSPLAVRVTREPSGERLHISVPILPGRWLILSMPDRPPPRGGWAILVGWMALIVAGVAAIALVVADRMTRPLALLEEAVATVKPDGTLPRLAEVGPSDVKATARALNRLSARLAQAMESRMRLVAAAGHDLRTPMTRMRLRVEFLEAESRDAFLADLAELDRIADSAIRLVREEVDGGEGTLLSLDAVVGDIADELAALAMPVTVVATAPVNVRAHPTALTRALRNLFANAATHGGGARVSVGRDGREAVVLVEDDGPGIPEPLIGRVFEPFFRVDPARRRSVPGAGLGLAIAREIVERFGGRIALSNRAPHGLRQEVRLPVAG